MKTPANFFNYILVLLTMAMIWGCSTESTPVYTLNVDVSPAEAGTVSPANGEFDDGEQVQVTATANEHWVFEGWQGDQAGSQNPISITMDSDKQVTAMFIEREYPLNLQVEGEGTISERIVQAKTNEYPHGTMVELTANADDGWEFAGWEGDLTGSENPELVTISGQTNITAVFEEVVTVSVEGSGRVEIEFLDDNEKRMKGAERRVRLTAIPENDNWSFAYWEGDIRSTENPVVTSFSNNLNVEAAFLSAERSWEEKFSDNRNIIADGEDTQLRSIYFWDESTGWAAGSSRSFADETMSSMGVVLHTNDGGESWVNQNIGIEGSHLVLYDIQFVSENMGWVVVRKNDISSTNGNTQTLSGKVLFTNDGGDTWNVQYEIEDGYPQSVKFIDENNGWVVGGFVTGSTGSAFVLKTENGGQNWNMTTIESADHFTTVDFTDENNGWASGFDTGLYHTTNGGASWALLNDSRFGNIGEGLYTISFVDDQTGWGTTLSSFSSIVHTVNGGVSWTSQKETDGSTNWKIDFLNSQQGVLGRGGEILETTDGGSTWTSPNIQIEGSSFTGVHILNSQTVWGVAGGKILRYGIN